jgi:hypothetical protein
MTVGSPGSVPSTYSPRRSAETTVRVDSHTGCVASVSKSMPKPAPMKRAATSTRRHEP